MQVMPGTFSDMAAELGFENPDLKDEWQNIHAGVYYLGKQLKDFKDPALALAAYNAGPDAVKKAGGIPKYKETINYVSNVLGPDKAHASVVKKDITPALDASAIVWDDAEPGMVTTSTPTKMEPVSSLDPSQVIWDDEPRPQTLFGVPVGPTDVSMIQPGFPEAEQMAPIPEKRQDFQRAAIPPLPGPDVFQGVQSPEQAAKDYFEAQPAISERQPTAFDPNKEQQFQAWIRALPWFSEFKAKYGEEPNLNDPQYDYRKAWEAGVVPERNKHDGLYHWSSSDPRTGEMLKSEDHPTAWMEHFMRKFGYDPQDKGITEDVGKRMLVESESGQKPAFDASKEFPPQDDHPLPAGAFTREADYLKYLDQYERSRPQKSLADRFIHNIPNVPSALGKQAVRAIPSWGQTAYSLLQAGGENLAKLGEKTGIAPWKEMGNVVGQFGKENADWIQKNVLDKAWLNLPKEKRERLIEHPEYLADPEYLAFNVADAAVSMAPTIAAYFVGGKAAAGAVGGGMEGLGLYRDLREKGVDASTALTWSTAYGTVSGVLNAIGADKVLKRVPGKTLRANIARRIISGTWEAGTEYMEEPFQAAFGAIAQGKPWKGVVEDTVQSFKNVEVIPGSFIMGAGTSGAAVEPDKKGGDGTGGGTQIPPPVTPGLKSTDFLKNIETDLGIQPETVVPPSVPLTPPPAAPAAPTAPAGQGGGGEAAPVSQTPLTRDDLFKLHGLGYSYAEIDAMKPGEGEAIIQQGQRKADDGIVNLELRDAIEPVSKSAEESARITEQDLARREEDQRKLQQFQSKLLRSEEGRQLLRLQLEREQRTKGQEPSRADEQAELDAFYRQQRAKVDQPPTIPAPGKESSTALEEQAAKDEQLLDTPEGRIALAEQLAKEHGTVLRTTPTPETAMRRPLPMPTAPIEPTEGQHRPVVRPEPGTAASNLTDEHLVNDETMGQVEQRILDNNAGIRDELAKILEARVKAEGDEGLNTFQDWMNPAKIGGRIHAELMKQGMSSKDARAKLSELMKDYEWKYKEVLDTHRAGMASTSAPVVSEEEAKVKEEPTPVPVEPQPAPATPAPHQQTQSDYIAAEQAKLDKPFTPKGSATGTEAQFRVKAVIAHREHVENALQQGLDVPADVLKDYSELAKRYGKAGEKAPVVETLDPSRQKALDRYVESAKEYMGEDAARTRGLDWIKKIDDKDVISLRGIMNGINPNVNKLFTAITGLPAKTQKDADASLRSLDPEKWDRWQEDKEKSYTKKKEDREARQREDAVNSLLDEKVQYKDRPMTRREVFQENVDQGFNQIEQRQKGAVNEFFLVNNETGYQIKVPKLAVDYVQGLIDAKTPTQTTGATEEVSNEDLDRLFGKTPSPNPNQVTWTDMKGNARTGTVTGPVGNSKAVFNVEDAAGKTYPVRLSKLKDAETGEAWKAEVKEGAAPETSITLPHFQRTGFKSKANATRIAKAEGGTVVAGENGTWDVVKKAEQQRTIIGKNRDGQTIYADDKGVRYVMDGNIQIQEAVTLRPTRAGVVPEIKHTDEQFMTVEEVEAAKPPKSMAEASRDDVMAELRKQAEERRKKAESEKSEQKEPMLSTSEEMDDRDVIERSDFPEGYHVERSKLRGYYQPYYNGRRAGSGHESLAEAVEWINGDAKARTEMASEDKSGPSSPQAKLDSAADHMKAIAAGIKKINAIFGEEGSLSTKPIEESKWQQIRPVLDEMWGHAVAIEQDVKEFVSLVLDSLSLKAVPYFERYIDEKFSQKGESREEATSETKPPTPPPVTQAPLEKIPIPSGGLNHDKINSAWHSANRNLGDPRALSQVYSNLVGFHPRKSGVVSTRISLLKSIETALRKAIEIKHNLRYVGDNDYGHMLFEDKDGTRSYVNRVYGDTLSTEKTGPSQKREAQYLTKAESQAQRDVERKKEEERAAFNREARTTRNIENPDKETVLSHRQHMMEEIPKNETLISHVRSNPDMDNDFREMATRAVRNELESMENNAFRREKSPVDLKTPQGMREMQILNAGFGKGYRDVNEAIFDNNFFKDLHGKVRSIALERQSKPLGIINPDEVLDHERGFETFHTSQTLDEGFKILRVSGKPVHFSEAGGVDAFVYDMGDGEYAVVHLHSGSMFASSEKSLRDAIKEGQRALATVGEEKFKEDIKNLPRIEQPKDLSYNKSKGQSLTSDQGVENEANRLSNREPGEQSILASSPDVDAGKPTAENLGTVPKKETPPSSGREGYRSPATEPLVGEGEEDSGEPGRRDSDESDRDSGRRGRGDSTTSRSPERVTTAPDTGVELRSAEKPQQDHRIGENDILVPGGNIPRGQANLRAIELLKQLEAENREATPEEKKILAQFSGWGSLGQEVFNPDWESYAKYEARDNREPSWIDPTKLEKYRAWRDKWGKKLYPGFGGLMTEEEWDAAKASTQNAHYTSREVVQQGLWPIVQRLGLTKGTIIEPSAGIGHIIGLMPEVLHNNSKIIGIELDSITGRILKKLYPAADIQVTGFQSAKRIGPNSANLVISNFPFGSYPIFDKNHPAYSGWSIHNYFFARSLDAVKPGGLVVAITSHFTLDALGTKTRAYLNDKADLVGAVRLPNTAFKAEAGTDVTTDILIFRKKSATPFVGRTDFLHTVDVKTAEGDKVSVNEYFVKHPEMVLGEHSARGTMYAAKGKDKKEYTLMPTKGSTLANQLKEAISNLPAGIIEDLKGVGMDTVVRQDYASAEDSMREFSLVEKDGKIYTVTDGNLVPVRWGNDKQKAEAGSAYLKLKDVVKQLYLIEQSQDAKDSDMVPLRTKLNKIYDAFRKKHGTLHGPNEFLSEDAESSYVFGLERQVKKIDGNRTVVTWEKQPIFESRTNFPFQEPASAENIDDAIKISMVYRGGIDPGYIASLLGKSEQAAREEIMDSGNAFEDPGTGLLVDRDEYLSGNVKAKLHDAEIAARTGEQYDRNVKALEAVQPRDRGIDEISYRLGANWIPEDVVSAFATHLFGAKVKATYARGDDTSRWYISSSGGFDSAKIYDEWGVKDEGGSYRVSGIDLIEDSLNLKATEVRDKVETEAGNETSVKNPELTLLAHEKQRQLQVAFVQWTRNNDKAARQIENIYNERYNGFVTRTSTAPDIEYYPGAAHTVKLRDHQKAAVSRNVRESVIDAHAVGTGKTFIYVTTAMEMRRLGTAKKPLMVVHNATVGQYAAAFNALYPHAKILVPTENQYNEANRNRLLSSIITGDYDAVIIPQSVFNMIPNDPERERGFIKEQLAELEDVLREAIQEDGDKSPRVKQLQAARERKLARLQKLASGQKAKTVYFEDMGFDALLIDEAHAYKRGDFMTRMGNVKGVDKDSSQRSFSLLMKARSVQEKTNGKNVILATGTPISNTLTEAWTMAKYVRPDLLEQFHVQQFDDFATTFCSTKISQEETETGEFKDVERFAEFINGHQFLAFWRTAADVILKEDLNLPEPKLKTGRIQEVVIERSPELGTFIESVRDQRAAWDALSGREKIAQRHVPLVLFGDAKRAAVDLRLSNPTAKDDPKSKVNTMVKRALGIYKEHTATLSTQIIFCDTRKSKRNPSFDLYKDVRQKLIAGGVPAKEIVIINDVKTNADKQTLWDKVNAGEVRIVIGHSEKLGVGVNVNERLYAIHHVDAPLRPMDYEQRNGRILRQGNLYHDEVEILTYGVKNTLDSVAFQRLETKQKAINQAMRGDIESGTFENPFDEIQFSFADMMAAFSGNPLAKEKTKLENEIRNLTILRDQHLRGITEARHKIRATEERIADIEDTAEKQDKKKAWANKNFQGGKVQTVEIGGEKLSEGYLAKIDAEIDNIREEFAGRLEAIEGTPRDNQTWETMLKSKAKKWEPIWAGLNEKKSFTFSVNGFPVEVTLSPRYFSANAELSTPIQGEIRGGQWSLFDKPNGRELLGGSAQSGQSFTGSLYSLLEQINEAPQETRNRIPLLRENIKTFTDMLNVPFQRQAELDETNVRYREVLNELAAGHPEILHENAATGDYIADEFGEEEPTTTNLYSGFPLDELIRELGNVKADVQRLMPKLTDLGVRIMQNGHTKIRTFVTQMKDLLGRAYAKVKDVVLKVYAASKKAYDKLPDALKNESGMVAWHGSPHKFDKFSLEHIGSGEGAQAFGYGLYFAGKKQVAEWYKNHLTRGRNVVYDGEEIPYQRLEEMIAKEIDKTDPDMGKSTAFNFIYDFQTGNLPEESASMTARRNNLSDRGARALMEFAGGIERPPYADREQYVVKIPGGRRTDSKMSRQEQLATFDISGRLSWLNTKTSTPEQAMTKVVDQLKKTVAAQETWIKSATELGDEKELKSATRTRDEAQLALDTIEKYRLSAKKQEKQGALYKVDIPDDSDLLVWDKPLSEQSEKVKAALRTGSDRYKELVDARNALEDIPENDARYNELSQEAKKYLGIFTALRGKWRSGEYTGNSLYYAMTEGNMDNGKMASETLRSIGIPGHRYPEGQIAGGGKGGYNYVIYDDSAIDIKEMYSGFPVQELIRELQAAKADIEALMPRLTDLGTRIYARGHNTIRSFKAELSRVLGKAFDAVRRFVLKIYGAARRAYAKLPEAIRNERGAIQFKDLPASAKKKLEGTQVVGEDGKPLAVYHVTGADFDRFDPGFRGASFFSTNPENAFIASRASNNQGLGSFGPKRTMPVYIASRRLYGAGYVEPPGLPKWEGKVINTEEEGAAFQNEVSEFFNNMRVSDNERVNDFAKIIAKEQWELHHIDILDPKTGAYILKRTNEPMESRGGKWVRADDREMGWQIFERGPSPYDTTSDNIGKKALEALGYDGAYISDEGATMGAKTIAVWNPDQIVSALSPEGKTGFGYKQLNKQVEEYRGTGGIASEAKSSGFKPAFRDTQTGEIYPSKNADGSPAGIHLLDGMPEEVITKRDQDGDVVAVKDSIEAGFTRDGKFYTRDEAVRAQSAPETITRTSRVFRGTASTKSDALEKPIGLGMHFTESSKVASEFAEGEGGRILSATLNMKNPLRLPDIKGSHEDARAVADLLVKKKVLPANYVNDAFHERLLANGGDTSTTIFQQNNIDELARIKNILQEQGYDGIVYKNSVEGGGDSYIVFSPDQIVSALSPEGKTTPEVISRLNEIEAELKDLFKQYDEGAAEPVGENEVPKAKYARLDAISRKIDRLQAERESLSPSVKELPKPQPWQQTRQEHYGKDIGEPEEWRVSRPIGQIQDAHAWSVADAIQSGKEVKPEVVEPYAEIGAGWARDYLGTKFAKEYPDYATEVLLPSEFSPEKTSVKGEHKPLPNRLKLMRHLKDKYGLSLKETQSLVHGVERGEISPEDFRARLEKLKEGKARPIQEVAAPETITRADGTKVKQKDIDNEQADLLRKGMEERRLKALDTINNSRGRAKILEDLGGLGVSLIEQGADTFAKFRTRMQESLGDAFEKVKVFMRSVYRKAKELHKISVSTLKDSSGGLRLPGMKKDVNLSDYQKKHMSFDPEKGVDFSREGIRGFFDKAYAKVFMAEYQAKKLAKVFGGTEYASHLEDLIRRVRSRTSIAQTTLVDGPFKLDAQGNVTRTGPGLSEILSPLKTKQEMVDYDTFRNVLRVAALNRFRGQKMADMKTEASKMKAEIAKMRKEPGWGDRKSRQYVKAYRETIKEIKSIERLLVSLPLQDARDEFIRLKQAYTTNELSTWNDISDNHRKFEENAILKPLVDIGKLSQERFDAIKNSSESAYYASFMREMDDVGGVVAGGKTPGSIKQLKGSKRKMVPSIEGTIANVANVTKLLETQRVYQTIVGLRDVTPEAKDVIKLVKMRPDGLPPRNSIQVYKDGKTYNYQLPPEVFKGIDFYQPNEISFVWKLLGLPATTLRYGATLAIDFVVRNPVRDQFSAMTYSKHGYIPFVDLAKGIVHYFGDSDLYKEFKAAGGEQNFFSMIDREATNLKAAEIVGYKTEGMERVIRYAGSPLRAWKMLSESLEVGTRLGEYAKARGKGKSALEAQGLARDLTLDFQRKGGDQVVRAMNIVTAFWNANIQGTDKMVREFTNKETRLPTLMRSLLGITLPSLILWAVFHDDDRWKNLPDWRKNFFWNIPIGKTGPILSIPKPFELGIIFGSLPERILDWTYDKRKGSMKSVATAIVDGGLPGIIPTGPLPIIEGLVNYSFFMDAPLESMSERQLPPGMRANQYTSGMAKAIGGSINVSPKKIDNWVRAWTGNLGRMGLDLADTTVFKSDIPSVGRNWYEQPGFRAFFAKEPIGSAGKSVDTFYGHLEECSQAKSGYKVLSHQADASKADKYKEEKAVEISSAKQAEKTAERLSQMRKRKAAIIQDKQINSADKRMKIDEIDGKMTDVAEKFNARFEEKKKKQPKQFRHIANELTEQYGFK